MDAIASEPGRPKRRLFWLLVVLFFLTFATVAYVLHRPGAASHVVVIEAVDNATGQLLPLTVEFPPSKQGLDPWMPAVVAQSSSQIQLSWDDVESHDIRVGAAGHAEKTVTLDSKSSGRISVRVVRATE